MTEYFKGAKGSWIWLVLRLYLGYEWLSHGWAKVTGAKPFDATGFLKGAIAKSVPATPGATAPVHGWWADFLNGFAIPNVKLFNVLVPMGEILIGLSLILGFATIFAATMAMVMNFAFLLSGTTNTNPDYLAIEFIIVALGGAYAGYIGVDYWFRPRFRNYLAKLTGGRDASAKAAA